MSDEGDLNAELARRQAGAGHGRHNIGVPWPWFVGVTAAGAVMVASGLYAHYYRGPFAVGVGLLVVMASTVILRRRLDGPKLSYRSWGRRRVLDLREVTGVSTKDRGGQTFFELHAPSLEKPLLIGLRFNDAPPAALEQLRFWLEAPQVHWTDEARTALPELSAPNRLRGRLARGVFIAFIAINVGIAAAAALIYRSQDHGPGPEYGTVVGPAAKGLETGHPWGPSCQPVRFTVEASVPNWIYTEAAAVVAAARRDGINVTIETRAFDWDPRALYFPPGLDPVATPRVGIFARPKTPSSGRNAGRQRITLGWDTALDASGEHEVLTEVQGVLWLEAIDGSRPHARRALRRLVGLTQGVRSSNRTDSVFFFGDGPERYSRQDIKAMQKMSGCGDDAVPKRG